MKDIPVGAKGIYTITVGPEHLANRIEPMLAAVLSTPSMVSTMEMAAFLAIKPYLDEGETSVGAGIEVQHTAATPPGHQVRAEAELVKVDGRRFEFKVRVFDEVEQVGSAVHRRAVVNAAKFGERVKSKIKS